MYLLGTLKKNQFSNAGVLGLAVDRLDDRSFDGPFGGRNVGKLWQNWWIWDRWSLMMACLLLSEEEKKARLVPWLISPNVLLFPEEWSSKRSFFASVCRFSPNWSSVCDLFPQTSPPRSFVEFARNLHKQRFSEWVSDWLTDWLATGLENGGGEMRKAECN